MPTTLYLKQNVNANPWGDVYELTTTAPSTSTPQYQLYATAVSGGTNIQFRDNSSVVEFESIPLNAAATISGTISISIYAFENVMTANVGGRAIVYRLSGTTYTQIGAANDGVEFGTTSSLMSWTITPTSTAFAVGDKIAVRFFITNVGTMGTGEGYLNFGSTVHPSTVTFNENLTFNQVITVNRNEAATGADSLTAVRTTSIKYLSLRATGKGYVNGGNTTGDAQVTTYLGIQFLTETIFNSASTIIYRNSLAGVQSSTKGYFGGGISGAASSEIDGIQFSDETAINPTATLSVARYYVQGISSSAKGYFAGGRDVSFTSEIDGIQFSDETAINPAASLSAAKVSGVGLESSTKGYYAGGSLSNGTDLTTIDGLQFSNETATNPAATLSVARQLSSGFQSSTIGYVAGGVYLNVPYASEIDGINFSNETSIGLVATLNLGGRNEAAGVSSLLYGYVIGGSVVGFRSNSIDGFNFFTQSSISVSATLTEVRSRHAGIQTPSENIYDTQAIDSSSPILTLGASDTEAATLSESSDSTVTASYSVIVEQPSYVAGVGYAGGGNVARTVIDGMRFSDETAITAFATLSEGKYLLAGVSSSVKGYFGGGYRIDLASFVSTIDGINFSDGTPIVVSASLSIARSVVVGVQSLTRGYFAGGTTTSSPTTYSSEIDGIQFSDETAINPSATLSISRSGATGVSSSTKGYFGGGYTGTVLSEIDGIQFSDETSINPSATLSIARYSSGGTQSSTKGYWHGGWLSSGLTGDIEGIRFADEVSINPTANLSVSRTESAGVSSIINGYIMGGTSGSDRNDIDGIRFSDEAQVNPAAGLSVARRGVAGVSPASPSYSSGIRDITYFTRTLATNTITEAVSSSHTNLIVVPVSASDTLSAAHTQTADKTFIAIDFPVWADGKGYFAGGYTGAVSSEIDGIQFSDETAINPAATLAVARYTLASVNSSTKGYFAGGIAASNSSEIDGIQFSDETAINPTATLSAARAWPSGVSSATKGYFAGGYTATTADVTSEIDGIQFSDETAINPAATLSLARYGLAGVNSQTNGYFAGGYATTYSSEIDGIQFSDESAINPAATLSVARRYLSGAESSVKGYFAGGNPTNASTNEIDGIQFSDETAFNPAATLSNNIGTRPGGVSSAVAGYFGGGGPTASTYSKETYNIRFLDESSVSAAASLSVARQALAGVNTPSTAYAHVNATDVAVAIIQVGNQTFLMFFN